MILAAFIGIMAFPGNGEMGSHDSIAGDGSQKWLLLFLCSNLLMQKRLTLFGTAIL